MFFFRFLLFYQKWSTNTSLLSMNSDINIIINEYQTNIMEMNKKAHFFLCNKPVADKFILLFCEVVIEARDATNPYKESLYFSCRYWQLTNMFRMVDILILQTDNRDNNANYAATLVFTSTANCLRSILYICLLFQFTYPAIMWILVWA